MAIELVMPIGEVSLTSKTGDKVNLTTPEAKIDYEYNPESKNAQSGIAVAEAISSIEIPEVDLSSKMDKFGEVIGGNGEMFIDITNGNMVSDTYIKQTNNNYIRFNSGSMEIMGSNGITIKSYTIFSDNVDIDVCDIDNGSSAVNMYTLNQLLEGKENTWNKKDSIAEDIIINEPNAYPSLAAVYNFVNETVGDIEAAAANIIALQEAYIGGNA